MNNFVPEKDENPEQKNDGVTTPSQNKMPPAAPIPPQMPAYYYPQLPKKEATGRRVGTITMACALIAVGILLLIGTFNQSLSFLLVAKLAPIILIVLGIEILVRYSFSKGERLRYDFLSGFICFILIIGSLCMAVIPELWKNWGPNREIMEESLRSDVSNVCATALNAAPEINGLNVALSLNRTELPDEMSVSDLQSHDYIGVSVEVQNNFADKTAFAEAAKSILTNLSNTGVPFDTITICSNENSKAEGYQIELSDGLGFNRTVEQIEAGTDVISYIVETDDEYQAFAETFWEEYQSFLNGDPVEEFVE